jgi:hypothetical protein
MGKAIKGWPVPLSYPVAVSSNGIRPTITPKGSKPLASLGDVRNENASADAGSAAATASAQQAQAEQMRDQAAAAERKQAEQMRDQAAAAERKQAEAEEWEQKRRREEEAVADAERQRVEEDEANAELERLAATQAQASANARQQQDARTQEEAQRAQEAEQQQQQQKLNQQQQELAQQKQAELDRVEKDQANAARRLSSQQAAATNTAAIRTGSRTPSISEPAHFNTATEADDDVNEDEIAPAKAAAPTVRFNSTGPQKQQSATSGKPSSSSHNTGIGLCFRALQTNNSRFNCDRHDAPGKEKISKGTLMWGCRECDFDVCEMCYRKDLIKNKQQLIEARVVRPTDANGDEKADRDIQLQVASGYKYKKPVPPEPPKPKVKKPKLHSRKDGRCFKALRTYDGAFNCDRHDPEGKQKIAKGTLVAGCRDCDFDVCMHCWKQLNPDQYERDMESFGERSRPGHDCKGGLCIKGALTIDDQFNCDKHDPEGVESIPKGTLMWGCRDCDYDWCGNCFSEKDKVQHSKDCRKFGVEAPDFDHDAKKGGHSCLVAQRTTDAEFNCDKHDKKHREKIPEGSLMWGCRECDMDWCKACFKHVDPQQYEKDVNREVGGVVEATRSESGHGEPSDWACIVPFRTTSKTTNCDKHDVPGKQKIPLGTLMWGCKICDWDCCAVSV